MAAPFKSSSSGNRLVLARMSPSNSGDKKERFEKTLILNKGTEIEKKRGEEDEKMYRLRRKGLKRRGQRKDIH